MFFSVNVPFQKHEVEDYERRRYRGFDQRIVHWREEKILKRILKVLEKRDLSSERNARRSSREVPLALDAPCGYGRFTRLLCEHNFRLVSSDLSFHMVSRARAKGLVPSSSIGLVSNMTQGLPFRSDLFPFILSMRFFHHLHNEEDRRAVLKEFGRTSCGYVALSFYQTNPLHLLQRRLKRTIKRTKTRIKMVPRRQFIREAEDSGFEVIRIFCVFRGVHSQHVALLKKTSFAG